MALTWHGIEFTELAPASPKEIYANDGARVVRQYLVDWDERFNLTQELLGYPLVGAVAGSVNTVLRQTPHPYHPENLDKPFLYAMRVTEIEPWGKPTSATQTADAPAPVYTKAKLTVEYEAPTYSVLEDDEVAEPSFPGGGNESRRYCTITLKPAGEFLTLPQGYFKWVSDGQIVAQTVGKVDVYQDLVVTWHQVPDIPPGLSRLVGTVNDQVMQFEKNGKVVLDAAMDTLLLVDAEPKPIMSAIGDRLFDITYRWRYRRQTHQKFRRRRDKVDAGNGETTPSYDFELMTLDGKETYRADPLNYVFERKDHRYLFCFGAPP